MQFPSPLESMKSLHLHDRSVNLLKKSIVLKDILIAGISRNPEGLDRFVIAYQFLSKYREYI